MDVATLQASRAAGDKRYGSLGSHAIPFMSRMNGGVENAVMLVCGDSTGDESNVAGRWVLLVAQWLAAQYPAYTVNYRQWNFTNNNYDALGSGKSQIVQTGTGTGNSGGPFVIDIYNSSASGQGPSYHYNLTRFGQVTSGITPHLIFVNHGHNIGSASGATSNYEIGRLARSLRDAFPLAGILLTAQNAPGPLATDYALDYVRARAVQYLAATEGYGLVNVFQRFINNASYVTQWTNNTDGLWVHPSTAGSIVWRDEVVKHLATAQRTNVVPTGRSATDRLWVPAVSFMSYEGSPVLAVVNNNVPMWSFPNAATTSIVATVDLPAHWTQYDTYLYWTVASSSGFTGSTITRWHLLRQTEALGASLPRQVGPSAPGAWIDPGAVSLNPNNGSAYQTFIGLLAQQSTTGVGNITGIRVRRTGSDGTDNIAEAAYVLGIMLVKATA